MHTHLLYTRHLEDSGMYNTHAICDLGPSLRKEAAIVITTAMRRPDKKHRPSERNLGWEPAMTPQSGDEPLFQAEGRACRDTLRQGQALGKGWRSRREDLWICTAEGGLRPLGSLSQNNELGSGTEWGAK